MCISTFSGDYILHVVTSRSERELLDRARDNLMKKLVEVEMDGQAAAKQVAALRDTIRRLREVRLLYKIH